MNGTRRGELGGNLIAYRKKGKDMLHHTAAKNDSEEEKGENFKYFSYPKDGTKKTIPIGDTKIDFYNGIIILPDGSREELLTSLKEEGRKWARSVFVETNKDIKIWLDRESITPVAQGNSIGIPNAHFKVLWIKATEATEISAAASTNPEPIRKTKAEAPKAVITLSGDYVVVSGQVIAKISGEVVKVSGETVSLPATQVVKVSGEVVKISGETVIGKTSGETHISKISGEVVKVSGEAVGIVAPMLIRQGYSPIGAIPPLSGSTYLSSGVVLYVKVRNLPGNNNMWLGGSTVNSGDGSLLQGGEVDEFDIDNLNDVYLYASTSGQLVSWMGIAEV